MPKATLEFNLPEEQEEFNIAINAGNWLSVVLDLDSWLRNEYKYKERSSITLVEVRETLSDMLEDRGLNIP